MSQSFLALGVSAPVVRALEARNIHRPFAVQELVLPDALGGLDILAEAPTGSGKTLAFGLPLVERTAGTGAQPAALVLVPTRELATQVAADLRPLRGDERPARGDRLRRRGPRAAGEEGARRTRARRDTRAPQRPPRAAPDQARRCPNSRPRRGRSHARHGLQAAGRPHPAHRARPTARRCSSPPHSTAGSPSSHAPTHRTRLASARNYRATAGPERSSTRSCR